MMLPKWYKPSNTPRNQDETTLAFFTGGETPI
jgi:hypothetical protein